MPKLCLIILLLTIGGNAMGQGVDPMRPFNDTKPHIAAYDFYGAKKELAEKSE